MANLVEQIVNAFESSMATELGATYSELKYKQDVEKNNFKTNNKRYGVLPLGYSQADGVVKSFTAEQVFQVILTHGYVNKTDSTNQESKTFLLFDKMSEVYKLAMLKKLGISSVILSVSDLSVDDPEYLEDNDLIVLRGNFTIKYRESLD